MEIDEAGWEVLMIGTSNPGKAADDGMDRSPSDEVKRKNNKHSGQVDRTGSRGRLHKKQGERVDDGGWRMGGQRDEADGG